MIINLVDATNIERNLYLTTQLTETGVPVVIALNMADLIRKRGMKIDKKRLSELLNCPVIETSALKKTGLKELIEETVCTVKSGEKSIPKAIFSKELEAAIRAVEELFPTWIDDICVCRIFERISDRYVCAWRSVYRRNGCRYSDCGDPVDLTV